MNWLVSKITVQAIEVLKTDHCSTMQENWHCFQGREPWTAHWLVGWLVELHSSKKKLVISKEWDSSYFRSHCWNQKRIVVLIVKSLCLSQTYEGAEWVTTLIVKLLEAQKRQLFLKFSSTELPNIFTDYQLESHWNAHISLITNAVLLNNIDQLGTKPKHLLAKHFMETLYLVAPGEEKVNKVSEDFIRVKWCLGHNFETWATVRMLPGVDFHDRNYELEQEVKRYSMNW